MRELIDKQSALDLVRDKCLEVLDRCDKHYDVDVEDYVYNDIAICDTILACNKEIHNALSEMPTIDDAVPVVRCKECRHHKDEEVGMVYCPNVVGGWVEEEGYCHWAER